MRMYSEGIKLDFKDVLLVPQRSSLDSRAEVDLIRTYKFAHSKRELKGIGIIASNMSATGTFAMSKALTSYGMFTALHKHYQRDELVNFFIKNLDLWDNVFYTVGTREDDKTKLLEVKKCLEEGGKWRDDIPDIFPSLSISRNVPAL